MHQFGSNPLKTEVLKISIINFKSMLRPSNQHFLIASCLLVSMFSGACQNSESKAENIGNSEISDSANAKYLSQPLVSHIYTADPSAHVFENKIYI